MGLEVAEGICSYEKKNVAELWGKRGGTKGKVKKRKQMDQITSAQDGLLAFHGSRALRVWRVLLCEANQPLGSPLNRWFSLLGAPQG